MKSKATQKQIEVIAGPNGSGKTTFARSIFRKSEGSAIYLNPDLIAAGISPYAQEEASFQAGRLLLAEIQLRLKNNESFGFESTLSGRTYGSLLRSARERGYRIVIYFLKVGSPSQSLARIKNRVAEGGHNIPREAVMRRHLRCFENFWNLYRPLADDWYVFDNSGSSPKLSMEKISFDQLDLQAQQAFVRSFLRGKLK